MTHNPDLKFICWWKNGLEYVPCAVVPGQLSDGKTVDIVVLNVAGVQCDRRVNMADVRSALLDPKPEPEQDVLHEWIFAS